MTDLLHRLLAAGMTGALLALSGGVLQSVMHNPLAEPYMLGLVGGAAFCVAITLKMGWALLMPAALPVAALLGCLLALGVVCSVSVWARRRLLATGVDPALRSSQNHTVLSGFVTASFFCSLQMVVLVRATPETHAALAKWLYGDLASASSHALLAAALVLVFVFVRFLRLSRDLDLLELGTDEAACLGVNTRRVTCSAILLASLATAAAVSLAGAIGFVGLVAPHVARRLAGPRHLQYLPFAALIGAGLLIGADALGQPTGNLPAGIICALIGAPAFLVLLIAVGKGAGRDV